MRPVQWFTVSTASGRSRWAHLFHTTWAEKSDGEARALCGVSPYDHVTHATAVSFMPIRDGDTRCPGCVSHSGEQQ